MRRSPRVLLVLSFLTAFAAGGAVASSSEVRAVEAAFAKTMADRDLAGFASFLSPDAVFLGDDGRPLRGPDAILAAWKGFFEREPAPFSWEPEHVEVALSGDLAVSTGPIRDPSGTEIGRFVSTWRRGTDGSWKIVLDAGCPCAPPQKPERP